MPPRRPLLLNLDETSICYGQAKCIGLVAKKAKATYSRQLLRVCLTLVATVCGDASLQAGLPQFILSNGRWITSAVVASAAAAKLTCAETLVRKTARNTHEVTVHIVHKIGAVLAKHPQYQPILYMDTAGCHLHPAVLRVADEVNLKVLPVPAGATHVLQPCDAHLFAGLKRCVREEYRTLRSLSAEVLPEAFLRMLYMLCRKYLRGRRWAGAFQAVGFAQGSHTLTRELRKLFPHGKPDVGQDRLGKGELATLLPRRRKLLYQLWMGHRLILISGGKRIHYATRREALLVMGSGVFRCSL